MSINLFSVNSNFGQSFRIAILEQIWPLLLELLKSNSATFCLYEFIWKLLQIFKPYRIYSKSQNSNNILIGLSHKNSFKMAKMAFQHQAGTAMECLSVSFKIVHSFQYYLEFFIISKNWGKLVVKGSVVARLPSQVSFIFKVRKNYYNSMIEWLIMSVRGDC